MKDYTNGPAPGFLRLWWGNNALFPILLGLSVVVMTVFGYQQANFAAELDAQGVVVEATVVDRREVSARRDGQTERDYYVTFQYVAEGATRTVERKVPREMYRALTEGAARDVRYVRGNPDLIEHTIGETQRSGNRIWWISLGLGLAGLGAFWWTARPAVEALRARKFGAADWAKVIGVDVRIRRTKNGSTERYVLVWRDRDGQRGESLPSMSEARYRDWPPATDIEVYRDSRGKTWWIGDVGPRAAAATVPDAGKRTS